MIKVYALILITFLSGNASGGVASRSNSTDNIPVLLTNDQAGQQDAQCEKPKENYLEIENTRVRYVEAGAGPVVVLIHGNAGSVDNFDFKSLGLLCRCHRVIAVDRPGHGKSERPSDADAKLQYQTRLLHETLSGICRYLKASKNRTAR